MRRSCVSSGVHYGLEQEDGRLVGVLEVMRCVILARQSSNQRSSECGVGRAGGVDSVRSASSGEM